MRELALIDDEVLPVIEEEPELLDRNKAGEDLHSNKRKLTLCIDGCGKQTTQYYGGRCASCEVDRRVNMRLRGEYVIYPTDIPQRNLEVAYEKAKDADPKMAAKLLKMMRYYDPMMGR